MIKRIIARLDIKNEFLVKGIHLEGLRILGYPELFAEEYFKEDIDEIILQDVVASLYKRNQLSALTKKITQNIFSPITVGGGIRNIEDIREILTNGADRVSINTAAIENKDFIKQAVKIFGSSTITVNIEALKKENKYKVYSNTGRSETNIDVFDWIKEINDFGVGEVILTSINNEGTRRGFDLNLFEKASYKSKIPILAHGGTGEFDDVLKLFLNSDVSGIIIASAFHFNYYKKLLSKKPISHQGSTRHLADKDYYNKIGFGIKELKNYLKTKKMEIR